MFQCQPSMDFLKYPGILGNGILGLDGNAVFDIFNIWEAISCTSYPVLSSPGRWAGPVCSAVSSILGLVSGTVAFQVDMQ